MSPEKRVPVDSKVDISSITADANTNLQMIMDVGEHMNIHLNQIQKKQLSKAVQKIANTDAGRVIQDQMTSLKTMYFNLNQGSLGTVDFSVVIQPIVVHKRSK